MKKVLGILTTMAVLGAGVQQVSANDCAWSTAGKVLAGVTGGLLLAQAVQPAPTYRVETTYVAPAPVYVQPAPVYQSAPTVVYQQPVYCQAAPVIVAPAPVYYPRYYVPVPVIGFGYGYGGGHYHGHYHH